MRIISGYLGGRSINSTSKSTHPMSEKMRGAIFNALGDLSDLVVLDVFSGSGALSIESISRGAKLAVAIESNKLAQKNIETNVTNLDLSEKVRLIRSPLSGWLSTSDESNFDVVLVDPPYDKPQDKTISLLEDRLTSDGVLVLSYPPSLMLPKFKNLEIASDKNYGDSRLVFYKNPS